MSTSSSSLGREGSAYGAQSSLSVMVSIIMPAYNSERTIAESIESVRSQTYPHWELLVTDDCSADHTVEVVGRYVAQDSRIKLFRLERNGGGAVARNHSIAQAQGRYIAFLDSDDMWLPTKLEKQVAFMQQGQYAFTYTSYLTCDEHGHNTGIIVCRRQETLRSVLRDDKIGCLTMMYDTELTKGKVLMPDIRKRQDYGLKLNVLHICHRAYGLKEPLSVYRMNTQSVSHGNRRSLIKYNIEVYSKSLGWSRIRASLHFVLVFMPNYLLKRLRTRWVNA